MAHFSELMAAATVKEAEAVAAMEPQLEKEVTYLAALRLVQRIDDDLQRGIRHYRDRAGQLLTSLDEVVRAILSDNLILIEVSVTYVEQTTPAPAHLHLQAPV